MPVRYRGRAGMLKLATEHEARGSAVMEWWDGQGAAQVWERYGGAALLERAMGGHVLSAYSRTGKDEMATRILCQTIACLHAPRTISPPPLVDLREWFRDLENQASCYGGPFLCAAEVARKLLAEPREEVVLHGDIHHDNVLDFGERGWLAIDPKGLRGERAFDYANIFCNPDLACAEPPVAVRPEVFRRRVDVVVECSSLDRRRLLEWIIAWTGLSAVWFLDDNQNADIDLAIMQLAETALQDLN